MSLLVKALKWPQNQLFPGVCDSLTLSYQKAVFYFDLVTFFYSYICCFLTGVNIIVIFKIYSLFCLRSVFIVAYS